MLNPMLSYAAGCLAPLHMYIFRYISRLASCKWNREAPSFHKFQQFINCLQKNCNRKCKFATGNRK